MLTQEEHSEKKFQIDSDWQVCKTIAKSLTEWQALTRMSSRESKLFVRNVQLNS